MSALTQRLKTRASRAVTWLLTELAMPTPAPTPQPAGPTDLQAAENDLAVYRRRINGAVAFINDERHDPAVRSDLAQRMGLHTPAAPKTRTEAR